MLKGSNMAEHPTNSNALMQESLRRLARAKRRESFIRYGAVLTGVLILLLYFIVAKVTGLPGIGLLCVPFAVWLILIGVLAIVAAYMAEHA
ncbi:MAG: hypothetical protein EHM39_01420 [Chloroflexi bacterium]|nr:MAG: hypothetical protein EHM39_01420 [Chloroflexota bacterium]